MTLHDEIAAHSNGAHFLRADLHIHTYGKGGSYDVHDTGMTPQAVVDNWVAIQRCPFEDRPEIKVTKMITLPGGKRVPHMKDFTRLSLGQQQSILLTILLFSQSTAPLIIDQPEDNLDSEFVYTTLVRSLRAIKERRQVIVVTHNANIAVLGDAGLIIPLRAQSENSVVRDRGSIDTAATKDVVCTILEGSPKAFKRRHHLYGF